MTRYLSDPPPPHLADTRHEADHYWAAVEDNNDRRRDQRTEAADAGFVSAQPADDDWAEGFRSWMAEEVAGW